MTVDERNALILSRYNAGAKIKDIATEVGMAANSIGYVLKNLGVDRPGKPQKRWNDRADPTPAIKRLWAEGLCASQIGERLQIAPATVGAELTKLGLRSTESPRHRYDGIGGIGGRGKSDRGAFARIARRT